MKTLKTQIYYERLKGHKDSVITLYSPLGSQGNLLYSASIDGNIRIWDLCSKQIIHKSMLSLLQQSQLEQKNKSERLQFSCICFSEFVVYGSLTNGEIYSWNIKQNKIISKFIKHNKIVKVLLKMNSRVLVSASNDRKVLLWDTLSGQLQKQYTFDGIIDSLQSIDEILYVLVEKRQLYIIDVSINKIIKKINLKGQYTSIFLTKKYIILNSAAFILEIYDRQKMAEESLSLLKSIHLFTYWINYVYLLGSTLVCACDDKYIRFICLKKFEEIDKIEAHDSNVNMVQFCDGNLFTCSTDFSIRCWNIVQILKQQKERNLMTIEDIESKKYEVYLKLKKKKKKKGLTKKPKY